MDEVCNFFILEDDKATVCEIGGSDHNWPFELGYIKTLNGLEQVVPDHEVKERVFENKPLDDPKRPPGTKYFSLFETTPELPQKVGLGFEIALFGESESQRIYTAD